MPQACGNPSCRHHGNSMRERARLSCRQRMTRAEPGGTLEQNSWRSSKQASASGTSKRMSLLAYSMIFCTRAAHAGDWISSLRGAPGHHPLSLCT